MARSARLLLGLTLVLGFGSGAALAEGQAAPPQKGVRVAARVDKLEVPAGGTLQFEILISGKLNQTPEVELEPFEGFRVVSSGQSQQLSLEGRQFKQVLTVSYLLAAMQSGRHRLGPVKVTIGKEVFQTQPIEVTVVQGPEKEHSNRRTDLKGGLVL
ncbi:MAG: hypothetical protein COV76_07710 [Candidatus Omnitrophica bacterium CG11_big_fil_rev_8_21_14_0_20_64_10]|nr:MAG: hypothetical protein COV76_07710 [Candidatus Omnitrophica bacterium CG11_big_fil_rev_8_21_14_0_20_64_10]